MYSEVAATSIRTIQAALGVLAAMHLTGSYWPQQAHVEDGATFDFIVVGAGTAGSVIANRLTEDGSTNVLLLEAGGDPPLESHLPQLMLFLKRSRYDWNYTSENDKYTEKCHQNSFFELTLGKMLGGSSSLGYHNYGRGYPKDFHYWVEAAGDETWGWKNVLPYYKKSERFVSPKILNSPAKDFHGTDGNLGVSLDYREEEVNKYLGAYKEMGHEIVADINENQPLGYSQLPFIIADKARQSSAFAYLKPAKKRTNLHVLKHTQVNKILFDDNNNAVGVEAVTEGKSITVKATKEVIVSAGTFNTPKLLMLSGIGPKADLESKGIKVIADLPVGQNLQDLVGTTVVHHMEKLEHPKYPEPNESPAPALVGYVALDKSQKHPDYETMHFLIDTDVLVSFCSFGFRYSNEICDEVYQPGMKAVFNQIVLLNPKSRGHVKLRSSDPMEPPIIETNYLSEEEDVDNLVRYIEDFVPVVNTSYYRSVGGVMVLPKSSKCDDHDHGSSEYWRCYVSCMMSGMSYFSGTCAIGSVVDGRLLVKGVNRLRVADASVMPESISSNPSTTVVMIGEKAADFIKEDHKL